MTQDEVDKIYDYLHENYEYRDGELIAIKSKRGAHIGRKLGHLSTTGIHTKYIVCLKINKKRFNRGLAQYIYLFHYKILPKYIMHLDGNITNNCIENLKISSASKSNESRYAKGYFQEYNGFRVVMVWNKKKYTYGNYSSEVIAELVFKRVQELRYKNFETHDEILVKIKKEFHKYQKKNTRVVKGYKERWGKFIATIKIKNKSKHLGIFNTPDEAHEAYLKAKGVSHDSR